MSDVLIRVRKFCLFARPALGCAELGVVRRGVVHGGVIQRGAVAALVVGAVWGCGTGTDTDTSANMSSTTGPGASTTSLPPATSLPPSGTTQGNVAPIAPGSNDTDSVNTTSNNTASSNTASNGNGANSGSTDSSSTGSNDTEVPVTPTTGSTGNDDMTEPPNGGSNDISPVPSNTADPDPGGGDQTTTSTSDDGQNSTDTTAEQSDTTGVDTSNDTTDAQTTDEPTEPSPNNADCGSLLLCDDFEGVSAGGAPDDQLWSLPTGLPSSAVVVSTDQKRSGSQSLKATYSGGAPSMFYNTSIFPLPDNVVHFRAWVWFESSWENHITFAAVGPLPIEEWGDEIRFGGQHGKYYVNQAPSDSFSPNPWECTDCIAPTPETWTCLRGMFDFDQLQATLHVGDSIAVDLARDGWRNNEQISFPANPERFGLGFIDHNGSGPITAYFDDVALGHEPIPCE